MLAGGTTFTEPMPYQAIIEALRSVLPLLATASLPRAHLAAVVPLLLELKARLPDLPALPRLDAAREQARLFEGLARCLEGLTRPRPVLLILEDLHWAGAATVALLTDLAGRVGQHALLSLGTYREEAVARSHPLRSLRRRLQAQPASHLALSRLNASAVASIVRQVLGPDQVEALTRYFYVESEGKPLFLGELIRDWLESGQVGPGDDRWHAGQPSTGRLPASMQATIIGRVAWLSEPAQALAQIAAVIGPALDVELLREVSGWGEAPTLASERGQFDQVPALVQQAQAHAAAGGDYSTLGEPAIQALHAAAQAAFRRNDFTGSQALLVQRLALCLAIHDRAGEADAHLNLGGVAMRFRAIRTPTCIFPGPRACPRRWACAKTWPAWP